MNVYLIGYMASGKTTIGRLLAKKMEIPFYDLDEQIEKQQGKSVSDIFAKEGEEHFRKLESETLRSVSSSANSIVSCGGGTFCKVENREWIKNQGISVYLEVTLENIFVRLSNNATTRPIILANNQSETALKEFLTIHLGKRKADYEQADIIFDANGKKDDIVRELATYFWRFLKS
ncbi:MAG: shikimate kinase [Saprospiraceae bacterium]